MKHYFLFDQGIVHIVQLERIDFLPLWATSNKMRMSPWSGGGAVRVCVVKGMIQCSLCDLFPYAVYACKLSDREHPLYLRLVAGPRTDTLSFVLREHEIGEVSDCTFLL